jgi:hypothetical protein
MLDKIYKNTIKGYLYPFVLFLLLNYWWPIEDKRFTRSNSKIFTKTQTFYRNLFMFIMTGVLSLHNITV